MRRHHGELWHVVDAAEWILFPGGVKKAEEDDDLGERARTMSLCSSQSVSFAVQSASASATRRPNSGIASGPASGPASGCWETDSQPYSLEGSSIQFDSDSDHSSQVRSIIFFLN